MCATSLTSLIQISNRIVPAPSLADDMDGNPKTMHRVTF